MFIERSQPLKRALVCAPLLPEFDREGGSRRIYHFIQFLRDEGWSVTFICENALRGKERYVQVLVGEGGVTGFFIEGKLSRDGRLGAPKAGLLDYIVGLKRKSFPEETVAALKQAYRLLFHSKLITAQALERIDRELGGIPEVQYLASFIRSSQRGIVK